MLMFGGVVYAAATHETYVIPSSSMSGTLLPGDRVVAGWAAGHQPRRGEVWTFKAPKKASVDENVFVKRVVGMPGETVAVSGGKVWINGAALPEPYLTSGANYSMPPVTLGSDEYFVMGDNRSNSNDSHAWGPLKRDRLRGKVEYRYWPLDRAGGL
jgi:signal peptidase I